MKKELCNKPVRKKRIPKILYCLREKGHAGSHTPDLSDLVIGKLIVKRLAPPNKRTYTRWFVECEGIEKVVYASSILYGSTRGLLNYTGHSVRDEKPSPEYATVSNHFYNIFNPRANRHENYKDMPFYDDWNPKKGGAYRNGAQWILDNLGPRPGQGWSMDIIEHNKGFVPGNIRWSLRSGQERNKKHKILGQWSDEEFAVEARRRGYVKKINEKN